MMDGLTDPMTLRAFGCASCWPESPELARQALSGLHAEATLVDESHYMLHVTRCPVCGQSFLRVFTETIDWVDGDDPAVCSHMPVSESELAALGLEPTEAGVAALAPDRRYLCCDSPKGAPSTASWSVGLHVGWHD